MVRMSEIDMSKMVRIRNAKTGLENFYQVVAIFNLKEARVSLTLRSFRIRSSLDLWELRKKESLNADLVNFRIDEENKQNIADLLKRIGEQRKNYIRLHEKVHYSVQEDLGEGLYMEFRLNCRRPYHLSPEMSLFITENQIFVLIPAESSISLITDRFIEDVNNVQNIIG